MKLPEVGQVIGGKYEIVRILGSGGMGVVYEARHIRLKQPVAIKVPHLALAASQVFRERFEREAHATAQLQSVNAARVIDVDVLPGGAPFMVMEYLVGRDLESELRARTEPMPTETAVDIVSQCADAMAEAHSLGIVHRDLKPANVFLCSAQGRFIVKVLDFGVSKATAPGVTPSQAEGFVGTPWYSSPEQIRADDAADPRSDIWSLGVILYELLTGSPPFNGASNQVLVSVMTEQVPSIARRLPDLPQDLAAAVMTALAKHPDQRYQTMHALHDALAPFGVAQSVTATLANARGERGRLGGILVSEELISRRDLERALVEQGRQRKMLGSVLLGMGLVSRADLLTALAKQDGLGAASPSAPPMIDTTRHAVTERPRAAEGGAVKPKTKMPRWISPTLGYLLLGAIGAVLVSALWILYRR